MRQYALLTISLCILTIVGCQNNNQEATMQEEAPYTPTYSSYQSLDSLESTQSAETYEYEPTPVESDAQYSDDAQDESLTPAGVRMHTIAKGDTLYSLARRYYNDQSRWRDIWNANRDTIRNPDKIYLGSDIVIP